MEVVKLLEKQGIGGAAQPPDCMHIASCWIQTIQAKRSLQKTGGTASPSVALGRLIDKPQNPSLAGAFDGVGVLSNKTQLS